MVPLPKPRYIRGLREAAELLNPRALVDVSGRVFFLHFPPGNHPWNWNKALNYQTSGERHFHVTRSVDVYRLGGREIEVDGVEPRNGRAGPISPKSTVLLTCEIGRDRPGFRMRNRAPP